MDVLPDLPGGRPLKGRGAVSNATGRFERERRVRVDDGWGGPDGGDRDVPAPRPRTKVLVDATRTAITRNTSPDIPFDRSINPYRGCEHGCVYCYARPSHAWLGLSPGLDFETRILAKPEAPRLLARELARKGYRPAPIALGTNTDPYQPIERKLKITRGILEVLERCGHPVTIVTKSDGPLRDADILKAMAERNLARVYVSVTTLDGALARKLEPRAASPAKWIAAIAALNTAGIPAGVMVAPVIPALTDHEMDAILEAAAGAGAEEAGYILLRLPLEVKDLFAEWLRAHYPDRAERVLGLVRETRGGALNDPRFGRRLSGEGVYADLIKRRFEIARKRLGLGREGRAALDTSAFTPPGADARQLALF
ncbi:MAG: PA0069 family radical SAM protein [Alphaproteobacteria bacterium]|nr:PA0069 family radical SAM protein [Alphaproteobacteria bacterium]